MKRLATLAALLLAAPVTSQSLPDDMRASCGVALPGSLDFLLGEFAQMDRPQNTVIFEKRLDGCIYRAVFMEGADDRVMAYVDFDLRSGQVSLISKSSVGANAQSTDASLVVAEGRVSFQIRNRLGKFPEEPKRAAIQRDGADALLLIEERSIDQGKSWTETSSDRIIRIPQEQPTP